MQIEKRVESALRARAAATDDDGQTQWVAILNQLDGGQASLKEARPRRRLLVVIAALVIGLLPLLLLILPVLSTDGETVGGRGNSPTFDMTSYGTYRFENLRIENTRRGVKPGHIEVVSTVAWTEQNYPGEHDCTWIAYNGDDQQVGMITSEVSSQSPLATFPIEVPVEGGVDRVDHVRASCAAVRLDTPVAYDISGERVLGPFEWRTVGSGQEFDGVEVTFDVSWPVQLPDYPGMNTCHLELHRPSGQIVASQVFGLGVGPGPVKHRVWRDEFSDPAAIEEPNLLVAVACRPFTGERDTSSADAISAIEPLTPKDVNHDIERYYEEVKRRVEAWADSVDAESMTAQELQDAIFEMNAAMRDLDFGNAAWNGFYELAKRRHALCVLLPSGHPIRSDVCAQD